ncbi:hypothetical protein ElyMa_006459300 [Elysia marginata]|uniref:Uncharacterized protein n=1 Tax=Elysia marginata TaxID=1093978 RepID=A0AAV4HXS1_9GAST|nr:hypothetical protein ElyMa_006459300 [Elysia marginata]
MFVVREDQCLSGGPKPQVPTLFEFAGEVYVKRLSLSGRRIIQAGHRHLPNGPPKMSPQIPGKRPSKPETCRNVSKCPLPSRVWCCFGAAVVI